MADLLALTAELVGIPSVSHDEGAITERISGELGATPVADRRPARQQPRRPHRSRPLAATGDRGPHRHRADQRQRRGEDRGRHAVGMWGVRHEVGPGRDARARRARSRTRRSTSRSCSTKRRRSTRSTTGSRRLFSERPDLMAGDVALLGEPTDGMIEAGCQGTMRVELTLAGARAHTARPWMGRNAIHRLGPILHGSNRSRSAGPSSTVASTARRCKRCSSTGGVAGNVVPDRARLRVNHRFAPDRSAVEAEAMLRELLFVGRR